MPLCSITRTTRTSFEHVNALTGEEAIVDKPTPLPKFFDTVNMDNWQDIHCAIWGTPLPFPAPEIVRTGSRYRALRDGAGPSSPGRLRPSLRPPSPLRGLGAHLTEWVRSHGLDQHLGTAALCSFSHPNPSLRKPLEVSPFDINVVEEFRNELITALGGCQTGCRHVAAGQLFHLRLVHLLAMTGDDLDSQFPLDCENGLPLGVDEPIIVPEGVLAQKDDSEDTDSDLESLRCVDNYPSAKSEDNVQHVLGQYLEDIREGLAVGRFATDEALAAHLGCAVSEIAHGAHGDKEEIGGKKRTIFDGTSNGVNPRIRRHIRVKGSSPMGQDLAHAMAVDHSEGVLTALLEADASKAHRRLKVLWGAHRYHNEP